MTMVLRVLLFLFGMLEHFAIFIKIIVKEAHGFNRVENCFSLIPVTFSIVFVFHQGVLVTFFRATDRWQLTPLARKFFN